MMQPDFHVIGGKVISTIVDRHADEIQELIKHTYLLHHQNNTINPNSYFLRYPDKPKARIIALPAHVGGDINVSGLKWIASNPDNIARGVPRASAVLILNDNETGFPFACLESSIISAVRTTVSAALAAEYLSNQSKKKVRLGIIGAGLISRYFYRALCKGNWELEEVAIYDLNNDYASGFLEHPSLKAQKKKRVAGSAAEVIQNSDLIFFATSGVTPTISTFEWFAHNPVVLHISLRDLSPEILIQSNNVVDDIEHVLSASTSPHLAEQLVGHRQFINGSLAGFMEAEYSLDPSKPTIFSPMGLGVLDIALGKFIYDKAREQGSLTAIEHFFCNDYST